MTKTRSLDFLLPCLAEKIVEPETNWVPCQSAEQDNRNQGKLTAPSGLLSCATDGAKIK
jgi:hypothetical protein